jgi:hypothetical protein
MKELLGVLVAFALLLGGGALAVDVLGDRETMVPPPDAVAEAFTREAMCKRWDRAAEYLREPETWTREELEEMQRELVEAETVARNETRAVVTVRVPSRAAVRNFALTFDGDWKID